MHSTFLNKRVVRKITLNHVGRRGPKGDPGAGIIAGGSANQVLVKDSSTDFDTTWKTLTKSDVDLSNVDNTSDANKPVSTAQQVALDAKVAKSGDTMTGNLNFDVDKGIRLTSGTATSTATGLIQLKSDDEDSKAIIEFYDRNDSVTHWIQAHDYLTWYGSGNVVTDVFTGADTLVAPAVGVAPMPTGWRAQLTTTGTLPAPLTTGTNYYIRAVTTNNISLYPTSADAVADTNKIDITTTGTGTHTVVPDNDYNGNRHHHLSMEASDSAGLLQTRLGIGYGDDVVDVSVNQANLVIRRNSGMTNGNISFSGGGGGGNIKHDNNMDIYPQVLADGTKALRISLDVGSNPTLSAIGSDTLNVDDKLVVTQKVTIGSTTSQSSALHSQSDGSASAGYFEATTENIASIGVLRILSPTSAKRALDYRITGDTVPRLRFDASSGSGGGTITFGNGSLQDTTLYRNAANELKTDDKFVAALGIDSGGNKNTNVADGTDPTDGVNKGQLDDAISSGAPDATDAVKGKVQLSNDLGGTADAPTTPTAVHITGDESIAGTKTFTDVIAINGAAGDLLTINGTGTSNSIIRFKDDGTEKGALFSLNGGTTMTLRSQAATAISWDNSTTLKTITMSGDTVTIPDGVNIVVNATTGTKIGTSASQKLGFFDATPVAQTTSTGELIQGLRDLGLRASGSTAVPITTSGTVSFSGNFRTPTISRTSATTLTTGSPLVNLCDASTAPFTITLPSAASASGMTFVIKKVNVSANDVTIATTSSQTIDGAATHVLTGANRPSVTVVSDGSNWNLVNL